MACTTTLACTEWMSHPTRCCSRANSQVWPSATKTALQTPRNLTLISRRRSSSMRPLSSRSAATSGSVKRLPWVSFLSSQTTRDISSDLVNTAMSPVRSYLVSSGWPYRWRAWVYTSDACPTLILRWFSERRSIGATRLVTEFSTITSPCPSSASTTTIRSA